MSGELGTAAEECNTWFYEHYGFDIGERKELFEVDILLMLCASLIRELEELRSWVQA